MIKKEEEFLKQNTQPGVLYTDPDDGNKMLLQEMMQENLKDIKENKYGGECDVFMFCKILPVKISFLSTAMTLENGTKKYQESYNFGKEDLDQTFKSLEDGDEGPKEHFYLIHKKGRNALENHFALGLTESQLQKSTELMNNQAILFQGSTFERRHAREYLYIPDDISKIFTNDLP